MHVLHFESKFMTLPLYLGATNIELGVLWNCVFFFFIFLPYISYEIRADVSCGIVDWENVRFLTPGYSLWPRILVFSFLQGTLEPALSPRKVIDIHQVQLAQEVPQDVEKLDYTLLMTVEMKNFLTTPWVWSEFPRQSLDSWIHDSENQ